jgi:DNA segregation ATPase FtsK/SpoIIIE-like protein
MPSNVKQLYKVNMNKSEVMQAMFKTGKTSIPFVQNKLKVSYNEAIKLIEEIEHKLHYQTLVNKE